MINKQIAWAVSGEDEIATEFQDLDEVQHYMQALQTLDNGTAILWERVRCDPKAQWIAKLEKFLFGGRQTHRIHFILNWIEGWATLAFVNEKKSIFEVIRDHPYDNVPQNVRIRLSSEPLPVEANLCLTKEYAFELCYKYLATKLIPKCVSGST